MEIMKKPFFKSMCKKIGKVESPGVLNVNEQKTRKRIPGTSWDTEDMDSHAQPQSPRVDIVSI